MELVHTYHQEISRSQMAIKRPNGEGIVVKLRQVEGLMGQGMPQFETIRQINVTEQAYDRWNKKHSGMGPQQPKELRLLKKRTSGFGARFLT